MNTRFKCRSNIFSVTVFAIVGSNFSKRLDVTLAHLGRDLEADVQQLAEARGCTAASSDRGEGRRCIARLSSRALHRRGQLALVSMSITVAYGGAQLVESAQRLAVDILGDLQPSPPALARPINSSSQVVPAVLMCRPALCCLHGPADRAVDRELVAAGMDAELEVQPAVRIP
jgi:hypothetical protein